MRDTAAPFAPALLTCCLVAPGCAATGPLGAAPSDAPQLLVADVGAGTVLRVDGVTGDVLDVVVDAALLDADAAPRGFSPSALAWADADGSRTERDLLVANFVSGELLRVSPTDGRWLETLHANDPDGVRIEEPAAMVVVDGVAAVLGNDTRNLVLVDGLGDPTELGGDNLPTIRDGHALASLPDGRLAIGTGPSGEAGLLQLWDPTTGERDAVLLDDDDMVEVTGMALGSDGLLHVVDWWAETVWSVDPDSGEPVEQLLGPDVLTDPVTATFHGDVLYVLQRHSIVRWHPATGPSELAGGAIDFGRDLLIVP